MNTEIPPHMTTFSAEVWMIFIEMELAEYNSPYVDEAWRAYLLKELKKSFRQLGRAYKGTQDWTPAT